MAYVVERMISTGGREENVSLMVTFPCGEEALIEKFEVKDLKTLYFTDFPDSKMSVESFDRIMFQAEDRGEKLKSQIEAVVKFLKKQIKAHPDWKGCRDEIRLSFEDSIIWYQCMKNDYKHKDEHVKVWAHGRDLSIAYNREVE